MRLNGTFGGNIELVAFATRFQKIVYCYQENGKILVIKPIEQIQGNIKTIHIFYHRWKHYSSIRNINGPYNGLPNIVTLLFILECFYD